MSISTVLVYEDGVFRPLQPLQLPEHRVFRATLAPASEDEREMTNDQLDALNAELGFDVRDEVQWQAHIAAQQQAWKELLETVETEIDFHPNAPSDGARRHDYYIYEQEREYNADGEK